MQMGSRRIRLGRNQVLGRTLGLCISRGSRDRWQWPSRRIPNHHGRLRQYEDKGGGVLEEKLCESVFCKCIPRCSVAGSPVVDVLEAILKVTGWVCPWLLC
jgi:hypothetical protein